MSAKRIIVNHLPAGRVSLASGQSVSGVVVVAGRDVSGPVYLVRFMDGVVFNEQWLREEELTAEVGGEAWKGGS